MTASQALGSLPVMSTGAWYEDRPLELPAPRSWRVTSHDPAVPQPLDDAAIAAAFATPVGPGLRELARGRRRPLIIVDDLTRPTPVDRLLPRVFAELQSAGIDPPDVSIMVATGAHGAASREASLRKIGAAGARSRVLPHDDLGEVVQLGHTSFGSRVDVDPEVMRSDLLIGIGGIYPQNSAAFGGGAKLVLGVLGRRSIEDLHFGHPSDDGRYDIDNDFRRDVGEMARMTRLAFSVSALVDRHRRLIWLGIGDHEAYYPGGVAEAKRMFTCAKPGEADVVIANAYPMDVSATFMRSKGIIPLLHARAGASRILIAACNEGVGHHGLFPLKPRRGLGADLQTLRRQLRYSPSKLPGLLMGRARSALPAAVHSPKHGGEPRANEILCFITSPSADLREGDVPGMRLFRDWDRVIETVAAEQAASSALEVHVYPCSPLQILGDDT